MQHKLLDRNRAALAIGPDRIFQHHFTAAAAELPVGTVGHGQARALPVLADLGLYPGAEVEADGEADLAALALLAGGDQQVLAAQLASESSWDPRAVSPAGATGLAQFMPEVWEQYAVDGDDDGDRDIFDPVDAIHSAAELNCVNAELVADVPGDRLRNILAAYNAGFNQVVRYEGVPPFPETEQYVERVLSRAERIELQ